MLRVAVVLCMAALAVAGCDEDGGGDGGRLSVVATTTQVADLVRNVGGDRIDLTTLLSPKADPHDYEPVPSDARALARADVIFRSGGELDGWLDDVLDNAPDDARIVTLIDSVKQRRQDGDLDPHWWQDPRNGIRAVTAIERALGSPFRRRGAAYARRLRALDGRIARCIATVPRQRRKIVTTHDALGYYARRYGIQVVGALIPSLSTQAQPSARDVERLVDQIKTERVETIFPESALNPKLERAVSREAGAKVGERLWADSLGPAGSDGATYVESLTSNTRKLVAGMTGGRRTCDPR
jgi:ABC-type Zn uptake system ZnuABC Zn-binding protein ZnuA